MVYIDCDGVIVDDLSLMFNDFDKERIKNPNLNLIYFVSNYDWESLLDRAPVINDSLNILRELGSSVTILSKIVSLENEGVAKVNYFRKSGITSNIILVPFNLKKSDLVAPSGSILVDDTIHILDDWEKKGGECLFFNHLGLDVDSWDDCNTKYQKVKSLNEIRKYINR